MGVSVTVDYVEIKFALARKGYTWARIARELNLSGGPSVSLVAQRKYQSARVEQRISEITEIPLHRLFPDRYKRAHRPTQRRATNGAGQ